MTTPAHSELAYRLTDHYFGGTVASVIKTLFNFDQVSFRLLKQSLPGTPVSELKKALLILVKHQLVDYIKAVKNFNHQYEYSVTPSRVFCLFRGEKLINLVYEKEGKLASIIVSILMEKALLKKEELIRLTNCQSQDKVSDQDIICCVEHLFGKRKFIASTSDNFCVNFERLNREQRDDIVVETISQFYNNDPKVKSICRAILELSFDNTSTDATITSPVPIMILLSRLLPEHIRLEVDKYLDKLTSEKVFRFFVRSGVHPQNGQMYALNIGLVIDYLVKEHLCSVITTRFGPKCCRVFRVLLLRGPLLLKQIDECVMLPARDVREYSYMLIKAGFIRNRQVPKTPDNAPGKSIFIMSVEMDQLVYNIADTCCRTMSNLLMRYGHEKLQNESLMARSDAVQKLIEQSNSKADSEDWNQYFSKHELNQLERVKATLDKLLLAKAQVDDTLFLMHTWLQLRPNMEIEFA